MSKKTIRSKHINTNHNKGISFTTLNNEELFKNTNILEINLHRFAKTGNYIDLMNIPRLFTNYDKDDLVPEDKELFTSVINLHQVSKAASYVGNNSGYAGVNHKPSLNTNNTESLEVKENETIENTIYLHKVAKTGNYNDLAIKYDITEDNYYISLLNSVKKTSSVIIGSYSLTLPSTNPIVQLLFYKRGESPQNVSVTGKVIGPTFDLKNNSTKTLTYNKWIENGYIFNEAFSSFYGDYVIGVVQQSDGKATVTLYNNNNSLQVEGCALDQNLNNINTTGSSWVFINNDVFNPPIILPATNIYLWAD